MHNAEHWPNTYFNNLAVFRPQGIKVCVRFSTLYMNVLNLEFSISVSINTMCANTLNKYCVC